MKKRNLILNMLCLCFLALSLFVFSGCGTEGSSGVQAIKFVKDVYYVDYNESTFLDYKVYPHTAGGYMVTFSHSDYITESQYFSFSNGTIKVIDKRFSGISVNVSIGDLKDTCEVKLRQYPRSIAFKESLGTLKSGSVKTLEIMGDFLGEQRALLPGEFNYRITSSDASVIKVIDSERLLVGSTGRRGESELTIEVLNGRGVSQNLKASIRLSVEENVSESFVILGQNVVKDGDNIELSLELYDEIGLLVNYFDADSFLIENAQYTVLLSCDNVLERVEREGKTVLIAKGAGEVKITLVSSAVDQAGLPLKTTLNVKVQILG